MAGLDQKVNTVACLMQVKTVYLTNGTSPHDQDILLVGHSGAPLSANPESMAMWVVIDNTYCQIS